jgi:hypothetical protein
VALGVELPVGTSTPMVAAEVSRHRLDRLDLDDPVHHPDSRPVQDRCGRPALLRDERSVQVPPEVWQGIVQWERVVDVDVGRSVVEDEEDLAASLTAKVGVEARSVGH